MKRISLIAALLLLLAPGLRAEPFQVLDIRIEGLQRISAGTVFNAIPVNVNDVVDAGVIADTARALFRTGNFDDVRIGRDGNVLVIVVAERPSISEINIDGNKAIETEALLEGLKGAGLSVGQVFQRSTLEQMRQELQRQYVAQGRYDASIETEVVDQARNRVDVNILIDEGNVAKIRHINIVGNTLYSDDDLLDTFELNTTNWLSWIRGDDKYSREKLQGDLETLESFYLDRGYIRFLIDSTQVSITPDRRAVYITINVTEGDQYKVSDVELSGDIILTEDELRRFIFVREGFTYSQALVTNSEEFITNRLGNEGYTFAKVSGVPEIDDEEKTVALKFFVDPGKRTYVNRIEFRGNTKTVDEVLRREMRQMENAPASNAAIELSKVRLERLGFFKQVDVDTTAVPGSDDLVDVEYTVEEQSSGSIGGSLGYAQDAGLILSANIQQNNWFGTGKQVGFGVNTSRFQTLYSFNYVNPYYTVDGVSRGFSVFYRSTDLDEINVASYTTDTWGGTVSFGYPIGETQRVGFSFGYNNTEITAGIGAVQEIRASPRPIPGVDQWILQPRTAPVFDEDGNLIDTGDAELGDPEELENLLVDLEPGFLDENGNEFSNLLWTTNWSQSALNRGLLATRGFSQGVSLELSLPGGDLEYYKLIYTGQLFVPLTRAFTLRLRTELGYADNYGGGDMPFFEHFFSGGFGSVRGFRANTLGPRSTPALRYRTDFTRNAFAEEGEFLGPDPTEAGYLSEVVNGERRLAQDQVFFTRRLAPFGGNVLVEGSAELLFPLPFVEDQRSLRSGIFLDYGNVFDTSCGSQQVNCFDVDLNELRYSVGIGVTWITGFGPLTFSLARPLNESEIDQTETFQFSIGQGF